MIRGGSQITKGETMFTTKTTNPGQSRRRNPRWPLKPTRQRGDGSAKGPRPRAPHYEPTPAEIEAACQVIQSRWTPADFCRRRVGDTRLTDDDIAADPAFGWTPPEYFTPDFRTRKPLAETS